MLEIHPACVYLVTALAPDSGTHWLRWMVQLMIVAENSLLNSVLIS